MERSGNSWGGGGGGRKGGRDIPFSLQVSARVFDSNGTL